MLSGRSNSVGSIPEKIWHVHIYIENEILFIFICIGELAVVEILRCSQDVALTLDPSHACECGLEDQSGKEDTTQLTIAFLMARRINVPTDLLDID